MQKEHVPYPEPRGDFQLRLTGLQIDDDDDEQEQSSAVIYFRRVCLCFLISGIHIWIK